MKNQLVTVVTNEKTKQFFVTFNNEDTDTTGFSRLKYNFNWVCKRIKEIEAGTKSLSKTPSILHSFDSGMFWAMKNSNLEDWSAVTDDKVIALEDVKTVEAAIAKSFEDKGYTNVRSHMAKGPEAKFMGSYAWGSWNPNKTLKQYKTMMAKIGKAMNTDISPKVVILAWSESTRNNGTINNKYDLYQFLKDHNVFSND